MIQKFILYLFFFCNLAVCTKAQNQETEPMYKKVDEYARSIRYEGNLQELTSSLTSPYTDTLEKLRAIFIWITDNIEYDYKKFNSGENDHFECSGTKESCSQARVAWEEDFLQTVLKRKKAVCNGYAKLFKRMCQLTGIQNEMVDGYVKKTPFQIGLTLSVTHSWNVVKIGGANLYFDITWAAGSCRMDEESGKLTDFVKQYQDFYWQTPLQKFTRNHFPKDPQWIAATGISKEQFFNAPYFYANNLTRNMESNMPDSGIIKAKVGDTLRFSFRFKNPIERIQVNTNNYKNVDLMLTNQAEWKDNVYHFSYVVKENSLYYIEVLFNGREAVRYKVRI